MKKQILLLLPLLLLASCAPVPTSQPGTSDEPTSSTTTNNTGITSELPPLSRTPSIVTPAGTPALGLANYLTSFENTDNITFAEASNLPAYFVSAKTDFIVAPLNIGAKMYVSNKNYKLLMNYVWGNLYIATLDETINEFSDLRGKDLHYFGTESATPYIVTNKLKSYFNYDINLINGGSAVTDLNPLLLNGTYKYIITAEPSLSALKMKNPKIKTIDIQELYKTMTGTTSYPQAAIFVNKEITNNYSGTFVGDIEEKILLANSDIEGTAKKATTLSCFSSTPEAVLKAAIPGSHFDLVSSEIQKESIEQYLDLINYEKPDSAFYYI